MVFLSVNGIGLSVSMRIVARIAARIEKRRKRRMILNLNGIFARKNGENGKFKPPREGREVMKNRSGFQASFLIVPYCRTKNIAQHGILAKLFFLLGDRGSNSDLAYIMHCLYT